MSDERKSDGTFQPGWKGGPGRPRRATEAARLATLNDVVTDDVWRQICIKAVDDAANAIDGKDREKGRRFIADYSIGRPRQTVNIVTDDDAWADDYSDVTDDELRAIAAGDVVDDPAPPAGSRNRQKHTGRQAPAKSRKRQARPGKTSPD